MKSIFACFMAVLFVAVSAAAQPREEKARTVELTLYPAKAPEPAQKYQLLPKADEQTDADAVPLYEKAAKSLPKNPQREQKIRQWLKTTLNELPRKQVQSTLQQLTPTLQLVEQAARYKQSKWPPFQPGTLPENLSEYRKITFALALQARLQIAQSQYNQAVKTIQTGFAMARHMGESPTIVQGMVGVAIATIMLNQVEELIQAPDSPNLYQALRALPEPLIDLNKQIELELENLKKYRNPITRMAFKKQLKPAHERVRMIMKKSDRHIAALQCIEALRLYAATNDGKFPNELNDVTEIPVPNDPVTQKPFVYSRTGSQAVLEGPVPEGGAAKDAIRYELKLKE